jgi:hypothetical protein
MIYLSHQYTINSSKMSPTYAQNKIHIYKYRKTHPEVVKRIAKEAQQKNMPKLLQYNMGRYRYQQECKKFRNILIDEQLSKESQSSITPVRFEDVVSCDFSSAKSNVTMLIENEQMCNNSTNIVLDNIVLTSVIPNHTLPSEKKRGRKNKDDRNFITPTLTPTLYDKQKQNIYNWRENNREYYNEKNKQYVLTYYYKHKDRLNAKRMGYSRYHTQAKQFRNILIAFYG